MRFQRADWPGIAVAVLAPTALMLLFLASFETWDHSGTPLLGTAGGALAVALGLLAAFWRFVRNWQLPAALLASLVLIVVAVNVLQRTDNDGTALATGLKVAGAADFLLLLAAVSAQILANGLMPVLGRRAARREAGAAEGGER